MLGKTRSLRRLSVWLESLDDASAMEMGRVLCARSKQQGEQSESQQAAVLPSISDGGLESLFVLAHAVSSKGVEALLQCADEHASLRALHLVANIVHDDALLVQQWYPHGSIIDDEEMVEDEGDIDDEEEEEEEEEEGGGGASSFDLQASEDPLEAQLVAETIGASRGVRDSAGERDEWATKEGVGRKYNSNSNNRPGARAKKLPEVVVQYGRRWAINHIFGLSPLPAGGSARASLKAPLSLTPRGFASSPSCSATPPASAAAAAATAATASPSLPCSWVEPVPSATFLQGTLFSPSSPFASLKISKEAAPEVVSDPSTVPSARSTQSRIASLANKRALAKELSRKSKMQTMRKRHATQSLYVLLYDELLSYANFSSLRTNMSTAALGLQHAAHHYPPSRSDERLKAVGAAVAGSEALVGIAVWDRAMGATQLGTLGSSLTASAASTKGRTTRGVQLLSVRGQLNRSETEVQASQWADRAGFVGLCPGLRQLDLSHGGLGSKPDEALQKLGQHLGKLIFPPPPVPPAPAPAKRAKAKKKKTDDGEEPKRPSKKAIARATERQRRRELQLGRETLQGPELLPLSLMSLNLRNNSITEKGVIALTEELKKAAARCKAEWKRDRELKEAKVKQLKEAEEKKAQEAQDGKGRGRKDKDKKGKDEKGKGEKDKDKKVAPPVACASATYSASGVAPCTACAVCPPGSSRLSCGGSSEGYCTPPVFNDPTLRVDLSSGQPLLSRIDLALNPAVPAAALQRLKEAIWGNGTGHCTN
jgi:hypothetical protein